ncbi:uncharacterized protein LOC132599802 [Lycium barbarum]|uniref:uncharacterized protein LOC132599802 n=1 Tax=Lycium barbarum TaxID=112863 RepID=UPI00293E6F9E|nr:uncharacterized protein LOC132599802 [Lycium barbarum]
MWDWLCFCFSFNSNNKYYQDNPSSQNLLPLQHDQNHSMQSLSPFSLSTMIFTSWLSRRYLCLFLCSPFLLPLFCATCPVICAAEICYRICRRRRSSWKSGEGSSVDGSDQGTFLLQRYLDDQLLLVIESMSSCGDEDGIDV